MTLEDLEALKPESVSTENLTQYVAMLVGENDSLKNQMLAMLDRQDRVAAVWASFILTLNTRAGKQNGAESI